MASKDKDHPKDTKATIGCIIPHEAIRLCGEAYGVSSMPDEAAAFLSEQVTYTLKTLIQNSLKHAHHSKRKTLSTADFDMALQAKNCEPIYGMQAKDHIPFRFASGGGRELHFIEEKELDLSDVVNSSLPKIPAELSLRAHWLSCGGVQPAIPENPPAASKEQQKKEILDTTVKTLIDRGHKTQKPGSDPLSRLKRKRPNSDTVKLKDLTTHELSVEQQFFYKEITEACVGPDETKRSEALNSLATDPGLHQMLPRFIMFVAEGVKINVVQNNLALLIYLMRMVKSLLDNHSLYLEKYLHGLIPAVTTCVVSRQLCLRPESDNHWALRDFAARLIATICRNFHSNHNNMQSRVTILYVEALTSDRRSLAARYGALSGLGELGSEVIKTCMLPHLLTLGQRMRAATEGPIINTVDKIACEHIKKQLTKYVPGVVKTSGVVESVEGYRELYGELGPLLLSCVQKERQVVSVMTAPPPSRPTLHLHHAGRPGQQIVLQSPGTPTLPSTSSLLTGRPGQQIVLQPPGTPSLPSTSSLLTGAVGVPPSPSGGGPGQHKLVLVTSQPRTLSGSVSDLTPGVGGTPVSAQAPPTIVKLVSSASAHPLGGAAGTLQSASGQKIVVIQGGNIKQETSLLQPTTPTVAGSIVSTAALAPLGGSTSLDMVGVKSVFPTQPGSISLVKKEEKP